MKTFPNITIEGNPVSENKAKPKATPHGVTVSAKNDDDSKIEARIAELVITHKAETELLKKSFEARAASRPPRPWLGIWKPFTTLVATVTEKWADQLARRKSVTS